MSKITSFSESYVDKMKDHCTDKVVEKMKTHLSQESSSQQHQQMMLQHVQEFCRNIFQEMKQSSVDFTTNSALFTESDAMDERLVERGEALEKQINQTLESLATSRQSIPELIAQLTKENLDSRNVVQAMIREEDEDESPDDPVKMFLPNMKDMNTLKCQYAKAVTNIVNVSTKLPKIVRTTEQALTSIEQNINRESNTVEIVMNALN